MPKYSWTRILENMKTSLVVLAVVLTGCVADHPVAPETDIAGVARYVSAEGDTLRLFADGSYRAKAPGGLMWLAGSWEDRGGVICAVPGVFAEHVWRCGARMEGDTIADEPSVFYWDTYPRVWERTS